MCIQKSYMFSSHEIIEPKVTHFFCTAENCLRLLKFQEIQI